MNQIKQITNVFLIAVLIASSCTDDKISEYEKCISQANRIVIEYKLLDKSIKLEKEQIENFKKILVQNINPTTQRKFRADIQIDLYSDDKKLGRLMIADTAQTPFVNFSSDKSTIGFQLTYGIGMFLREIK